MEPTAAPVVNEQDPAPIAGWTAEGAGADAAAAPVATARRRHRGHPALRRRLLLGVLFVALAVAMVFPSPTKLASHVPGDLGDASLLEWVMRWDAHALATDPGGIFSPNIYWPTPDTLVYTDTFIPASLVAAPLRALVGWPLSFNLFYLANWAGSLATAYLLVRWFTRETISAVVGAVVFGFAAVRFAHYIHFNHSFAFLVPLAVWLLLRFLTERHRDGVWVALAVALGATSATLFMSQGYLALGLAFLVPFVVGAWVVAERFRPGRRFWAGLGLAAAVTLVLCGPVVAKVRDQGDQLTRGYQPSFAAVPSDFAAPAVGSYLYGALDRWADRGPENRLFPGVVAVGLAVVGVAAVARHRLLAPTALGPRRGRATTSRSGNGGHSAWASAADQRRALWALCAGGGFLVLVSLGNYQTVAGRRIPLPYALVAKLGAGFATVRAYGRFFTVSLAVLAVLAGLGLARLLEGRSPRFCALAGVVVASVMLVEYAGPVTLHPRFDLPEHTAVNEALAQLPPGPVVELPMGDSGGDPLWPYVEAPRMVLSSLDWNPRVNGYSGYASPDHPRTVRLLNSLALPDEPDPGALARLDELGVAYIVVRLAPMAAAYDDPGRSHYGPEQVANLLRALPPERVEGVSTHGEALLVRLRPPP